MIRAALLAMMLQIVQAFVVRSHVPGARRAERVVCAEKRPGLERELAALQQEQRRIETKISQLRREGESIDGVRAGAPMSKILVIVPFPLDERGVANRRQQAADVALGPEVELDFRAIRAGCTSFESDHDWLLMDLGCYEAGIRAEAEGYAAVVIDCTAELGAGVGALRSTLSIPVIGPGRISCLYALMLGSNFAILASDQVAARPLNWHKLSCVCSLSH